MCTLSTALAGNSYLKKVPASILRPSNIANPQNKTNFNSDTIPGGKVCVRGERVATVFRPR